MAERKEKPQIRFKGFDAAWERRKLGEIAERVIRKNQDLVSTLPLTISAQYGLIDQNEFFDKRIASKDVSGYYLVKKGEFAYNKSTSSDAPWGAIKRLDRYEMGVLSTLYIVFAINENVEFDSDYLVTYYDTDLWHRGIREIAAEGARNHGLLNIAPADFFETSLSAPQDIKEQKSIGKYFTELNALITLHQRKHDKLVKVKKSMLDKMFPKNGADVPEIRFKGFDGAWERRKLGEIVERVSITNTSSKELPSVEYEDVVSEQGLLNKNIYQKETIKTGIKFSSEDVLYGKLRPYLHNWLNPDFQGVAVGDWWVLKPINLDKNFLYRLIQSPYFDDMANQSSGTKMPRADWKLMSDTEFCVPFNIEEQAKIGAYFLNLDCLITLHQRKLEKLKNLKKACLDKMFA